MRVLQLVIAVAIVVVVGCGSSESAKAKVDPAAAAGDVREVTGAVTAERDGSRRALALGDVVVAGELIETGSDGNVVIELRHNQVRWHLGPSQARKPIDAAAWTAAPPSGQVETGGDRTAAAGRLAEREGADTSTTAVAEAAETVEAEAVDDPAADAPEKLVERKGDPVKEKKKKPERARGKEPTSDKKPEDGGNSDSGCDEVACTLDPTAACCKKHRKCCGSGKAPDAPAELPEVLDRDAVAAGIAGVKAKLLACGDKFPGAGNIKLKVVVSPAGAVTSVTAEGVEDELLGCLTAAVKRAKFPATQRGGSFSYPLAL